MKKTILFVCFLASMQIVSAQYSLTSTNSNGVIQTLDSNTQTLTNGSDRFSLTDTPKRRKKSSSSDGPQNVVKLGLGSAIVQSDVNLKYERVFAEKHSISASFIYDTPESLGLDNFTNDPDAIGKVGTLSGFAVVPEYRYYFGANGAPKGFYAGAYARYRTRNLNASGNFGTDVEVEGKVNLRNFGGGIGCGAQWLINDKIAIDWYILGIGYNSFGLKATIKPTDPDDFEQLKQDVITELDNFEVPTDTQGADQVDLQALIDEFKAEVEKLDADDAVVTSPRLPFGLLDLRFGLSVGYAF